MMMVRVSVTDGEELVEPAVLALAQKGWEQRGVVFEVSTGDCVLFDSTVLGVDAVKAGGVAVSMKPGAYSIETSRLAIPGIDLVAHRLLPKR